MSPELLYVYKELSDRLHSVLGIVPVNEFTCISRSLSSIAPNPLPTHVAMLPERELNPRRNTFKDGILPSDVGTVPVKMLRFNRRAVTKLSLPNDDGMVPTKLFALRSSNVKLDSPPRDEGMDPVIPRPVSCTAVTMLLLHVTPVQNAVDPLQMDVVGEFDVHDQIE